MPEAFPPKSGNVAFVPEAFPPTSGNVTFVPEAFPPTSGNITFLLLALPHCFEHEDGSTDGNIERVETT